MSIKKKERNVTMRLALLSLSTIALFFSFSGAVPATAATPVPNNGKPPTTDISPVPLFLTKPVPPTAMIDLPKDQSLFRKAYNDYSDLNGDGRLETTYDNSVSYTGYFDSGVCYTYSGSMFTPERQATNHYCGSGDWSGNFLNWVTMSRMDIVRGILYGGKRSIDTDSETVLERAYLTPDAHSWVKYYNGRDSGELTPFNDINTTTTTTTSDSKNSFPSAYYDRYCDKGSYAKLTFTVQDQIFYVGDQVSVSPKTGPGSMTGGVCSTNANSVTIRVDQGASHGSGSYSSWVLKNLTQTGISFCNTSDGSGTSQSDASPPLMRVAKGDYALWSANEKRQCQWSDESNDSQANFDGGFRSNGNRAAFSGLAASAENPSRDENRLGGTDYKVVVAACVKGLIVNQQCKRYPDGDYKPIGLLHIYGDKDQIKFGLFTGSYNKNYSGGVLRANARGFSEEVNTDSDGRFTATNPIVDTLNKLRIFGYNYNYLNPYGVGDHCSYQITNPLANGEGHCRSWGNPMSEIYLESLRYLAGKQPTPAFSPTRSVLGLTLATWEDPLSSENYCSPLNVLVFNTGTATFDDDQMGGLQTDLHSQKSAQTLTDEIGVHENINGHRWFVGNTPQDQAALCTAKLVDGLGEIDGICPEKPSEHGSYLIAGAAWFAHTHRIRDDFNASGNDKTALKVSTYGVQLATNVPRIKVQVAGKPVTILPAYRLNHPNRGHGTGSLVDFKIIDQTATSGHFYIDWDDSNQGGDYDQDIWGTLSYTVHGDAITVTTDAVSASSGNGQGFGYTISGTTKDGPHFTSGIYNFSYSDPTSVVVTPGDHSNNTGGCETCNVSNPAASVTYTLGKTSAGSLQYPLYYAAKWGGFRDSNDNSLPDQQSEWDSDGNGQPDSYFYATNPLGLQQSLNQAFQSVSSTAASASAVASSSTSLRNDTLVYQASLLSADAKGDWTGNLKALAVDSNQTIGTSGPWQAQRQLDQQNWDTGRIIATYDPHKSGARKGIPFRWGSNGGNDDIDTTTQLGQALMSDAKDTLAEARLDYLRGDTSHEEVNNGGTFRNRTHILGDIVDSNPLYVGPPSGYRSDASYTSFVSQHRGRAPVVYVGANDGMLHAFDAETGRERFAFIPHGVFDKLIDLTKSSYNQNHHFFVDGSPVAEDVKFADGSWHTILVGGLNNGGDSIYALDVTDPGAINREQALAGKVLWEFTDDKLGKTYSQPVISQIAVDGKTHWVVIFGSGYNNSDNRPYLYILDAETGQLFSRVDLCQGQPGACDSGLPNGASSPAVVSHDGSAIADTVYIGDLQGNLWRTDMTVSDPNKLTDTLLFKATDNSGHKQPITTKPAVSLSPNYASQGGLLVFFGTGKYLGAADLTDEASQSFYGIYDRGAGATVARANLVQQEITTVAAPRADDFTVLRTVSNNAVNFNVQDGWYIDLPQAGERTVNPPHLVNGQLTFTTFAPSLGLCAAGGESYLMVLNYATGGSFPQPEIDLNGDYLLNSEDQVDDQNPAGVGLGKGYAAAVRTVQMQHGDIGTGVVTNLTPGGQKTLKLRGKSERRASWRQLR